MAVSPRQSLRSASQKPNTSPTATAKSPPSTKNCAKRSHDTFLANDQQHRPEPIKKLKPNSIDSKFTSTSHAYPGFSSLGLPIPVATQTSDSPIPGSRITTAVQPLADGTITTNGIPPVVSKRAKTPAKATIDKNNVKVTSKEADKRTLRSQAGGSRSRSELSLYFPNYEELISIEPKASEFLSPETKILIVEEEPRLTRETSKEICESVNFLPQLPQPKLTNGAIHEPDVPVTQNLTTEYEKLDFSGIHIAHHIEKDPLGDEYYFKAHRRAERQEKQLRNIERERAQHEKVQLERLLEGLRGHDWLRVMGISGITDSEKKAFEPKRDYFVREVRCLIEKFRRWKEEEKRRKVEKEQSVQADDEEQDEDSGIVYEEVDDPGTDAPTRRLNQIDRLAALQLQNETLSAAKPRKKPSHHLPAALEPDPGPEKPFTSFYSKPHERETALNKHRRGRSRFAFGQPVPEFSENDFRLPTDFVTPDAIRANARSRRAAKREVKSGQT